MQTWLEAIAPIAETAESASILGISCTTAFTCPPRFVLETPNTEIECCRCKTRASLPLDAIRRARDTPIWKLEPSFRCRSCGTRRYKPPVRMIKLTERREMTPYKWVPPDEDR